MLPFHIAAASTVVVHPTDTSAAAPFGGVFTCSVNGYGYQNITWYKQSGILPHKHKTDHITSKGVTTSTLIIPNVTEKDVGKYYCQVWANNIGVKSKASALQYSGMYIRISMINISVLMYVASYSIAIITQSLFFCTSMHM